MLFLCCRGPRHRPCWNCWAFRQSWGKSRLRAGDPAQRLGMTPRVARVSRPGDSEFGSQSAHTGRSAFLQPSPNRDARQPPEGTRGPCGWQPAQACLWESGILSGRGPVPAQMWDPVWAGPCACPDVAAPLGPSSAVTADAVLLATTPQGLAWGRSTATAKGARTLGPRAVSSPDLWLCTHHWCTWEEPGPVGAGLGRWEPVSAAGSSAVPG